MSFISVPTLYSYVPTCPACGSPRTGRYVRMTPFTEEYTQLEALRYGEIIQPAGERKHLEGELFCVTCGNIWRGRTMTRRATDARMPGTTIVDMRVEAAPNSGGLPGSMRPPAGIQGGTRKENGTRKDCGDSLRT